jgi:site-specific DNA recombinase
MIAPQDLIGRRVACFQWFLVLCGCLGLFGIGFSTNSAHPVASGTDFLCSISNCTPSRPRRREGAGDSSPSINTSERCASYARYSSDNQREESITDQQRKCREAAARNGHAIERDFEFQDEAVSGTKLHRAGLDRMLAAAAAGEFSTLYFHSLSRLARESVITMPLLKKLVHVDRVRVISVTEGIDSDRDGWEVLATILSVMHERYIKDLGDNVFRGQEGAVLAGFSVGDYCFGYTSAPIPGSENARKGRNAKLRMAYTVDERTAPWVIRIFDWFVVDKCSVRWITRELNRLGAPKDHRSTTKLWHHQQVTALLKNKKYIGVWPWGQKKNMRNPLTGQVSQDERPEEDHEKWTRHFPHLRLISDELMNMAQTRLDANDRQQEHRRKPSGKLAGSVSGNSRTQPLHLLSGSLRCAGCGATLRVGGAGGRYMTCPNWAKGVCDCKAQTRRDLAERMILDAIGQQILANPAWHQDVFNRTLQAWRQRAERQPAERQSLVKALAEVERKITQLLDAIESGLDDPEVKVRLAERRKVRDALKRQLDHEQHAVAEPRPEPTEQWVVERLQHLDEVLHGSGPAAALALRHLVGGKVLVREVRLPGRERHYTQGSFAVRLGQLMESVGDMPPTAAAGIDRESNGDRVEDIVIDFRAEDPSVQIIDDVKALWDEGLTYREIAAQVGWNRNLVTEALAKWFRQRGLEPPDGRSCRGRLDRSTLADQLAERAKDLWDQGHLVHDIAATLGCNRDTATKAIQHWFQSRGLEAPDGRTRRKTLAVKSSCHRNDVDPHSDNVDPCGRGPVPE